jgi:hypothetical protein
LLALARRVGGAVSDRNHGGHPDRHNSPAHGECIHSREFLVGCGERRVQTFDFSEPRLVAGFGDPFDQVGADRDKAVFLRWIWAE